MGEFCTECRPVGSILGIFWVLKLVPLVNYVKIPPFPSTSWKIPPLGLQNCPRASGPRAVLETRGRHFSQDVSGKGGILYHNWFSEHNLWIKIIFSWFWPNSSPILTAKVPTCTWWNWQLWPFQVQQFHQYGIAWLIKITYLSPLFLSLPVRQLDVGTVALDTLLWTN